MNYTTMTATVASIAMLTLLGCATPRSSLSTSAERLERSTDSLARTVSDESARDASRSYARDAQALADDARSLRRVAEERGARDSDVRAAFDRVSRSYHEVRDDVDRSDDRAAREDLRSVTQSYLDVERDMGGYSGRPYPDRTYSDRPTG